MCRKFFLIVSTMVLISILSSVIYSEVPQTISYQGYLTKSNGQPVAETNLDFTFTIYDAATGNGTIGQTVAPDQTAETKAE